MSEVKGRFIAPRRGVRGPYRSGFQPRCAMNLFGIPLRRPTFNQITSATILAIGLWLAFLGALRAAGQTIGAFDAGAVLLVGVWSCVGAQAGIRIGQGARHLLANVTVSALLLAAYQAATVVLA
jgi:hypothetical protein